MLFPLFQALRAFFEMHLMLVVGYVFFFAAWRLARPVRARAWARLGQAILIACVLLPPAMRLAPRSVLFEPAAHVIVGGTRTGTPYPVLAPLSLSSKQALSGNLISLGGHALEGVLGLWLLVSFSALVR